MPATNNAALPKNVGFLYVADYTTTITQLLQNVSNASAVKWVLDGLSYDRLASITDLEVIENLAENMLKVDTDDNGTILKITTPKVSVKWNWFELFEYAVIEKILGQNVVNQAWVLVPWFVQTFLANTVTKHKFYALTGQNSNGTQPTINSVMQGVNLLVDGTDYEIVLRDDGIRGISFLTPFDDAKNTDVDYDYTPATAKFQGSVIAPTVIPPLVMKIESTDPITNLMKKYYLVNCGLESDLVSSFLDVVRAGDMKPTAFEFVGNKLGYLLKYNEV